MNTCNPNKNNNWQEVNSSVNVYVNFKPTHSPEHLTDIIDICPMGQLAHTKSPWGGGGGVRERKLIPGNKNTIRFYYEIVRQ